MGPAPEQASAEDAAQRARSASRGGEAASADGARKSPRIGSLEEVYRVPGSSARVQALIDYYSGLSVEQLAEEAEKLENLPMNERIMASFLLFSRWAEEDPTAAMSFSRTMGFAGAFVRPTILQSWASVDPENAARYYGENPREFAMMGAMGGGGGLGGQGPASIIAAEWARQDPAGALAWAGSLKEEEQGEAMTAVVSEMAKTDPRRAAEMVATMAPADRPGAYASIASQWGAENFTEAQAWVRTLPLDQQDEAMASAIQGFATKDAPGAAAAISAMASGDARDEVVGPTVRVWAREDPVAAKNWLMSLDGEEAQRAGVRDLMPQWTLQDPAAALAFLNDQPAGPVRDSAVASYVWSNNSGNPRDLIGIASTIDNDGERARAMGVASANWMREEPEEARNFIQQSPDIPDQMRERLLDGRGAWGGGGQRGGRRWR